MEKKIIQKKKKEPERTALISIFLNDDSKIEYGFNEECSETIIENNIYLAGIMSKIQKELLEIEEENYQGEDYDKEEPSEEPESEDGEPD